MFSARPSLKHVRACSYCRKRKVKCDGGETCRNCVNHGEICFYPPSQRGKRSRPRPRETVDDRIARLESFMQAATHDGMRSSPILGMNKSTPSSTGLFGFSHEPAQSTMDPQHEHLQSSGMLLDHPTGQLLATPSTSVALDAGALPGPHNASSALTESECSMLSPSQLQAIAESYNGRGSSELIRTPTHVVPTNHISPTQPRIWEHHGKLQLIRHQLPSLTSCRSRIVVHPLLRGWRQLGFAAHRRGRLCKDGAEAHHCLEPTTVLQDLDEWAR